MSQIDYSISPTDEVVEADGLKWYVRGSTTDDHLALGGHEAQLKPIMDLLCPPGKAYFNIGAHIGTWALRLANRASCVYAFEANLLTAQCLERNIELNELGSKVLVYPVALWDNDTDLVTMVDENDKATGGSTRAVVASNSARTIGTRRLDDLDLRPGDVGFISMDVEGAEARILRGAKETINLHRPNMLIELHENHPGTDPDLRQQVYDVLDELNYAYHSLFVSYPEEHLICQPAERVADFEAS